MTGIYKKDYEEELEYSLSQDRETYILSVWQGDSVVTVWFRKLELEAHLYNYGAIGHFWVKGWEYLRQLEYRIAILRDKYEYLGPKFCTPGEQKIALLCDFPPLNCSCYPAVPEKYLVPRENVWEPTEAAIDVMEELAVKDACDHITDAQLSELKKASNEFKKALLEGKDLVTCADADMHFHDVILSATNNRRLIQMLNNLSEQMYRYRMEYLKDERTHKTLIEEHDAIRRALKKHDKVKAGAAIRVHIDNQKRSILESLTEKEEDEEL